MVQNITPADGIRCTDGARARQRRMICAVRPRRPFADGATWRLSGADRKMAIKTTETLHAGRTQYCYSVAAETNATVTQLFISVSDQLPILPPPNNVVNFSRGVIKTQAKRYR